MTDTPAKKRVLLFVLHNFAMRMLDETGVLATLAAQDDLEVQVVTPVPDHQSIVEAHGLTWLSARRLPRSTSYLAKRTLGARLRGAVYAAIEKTLLRNRVGYKHLRYRYMEVAQVQIHLDRMQMPAERREMDAKRNFVSDKALGFPFSRSWWLFRLLYDFYYSTWQHNDIYAESLFEDFRPDILTLVHVQNEDMKPYVVAARRRNIPIVGVVASWDQPSNSGAPAKGISRYAVLSQMMQAQMGKYHHVPPQQIDVVGWPQMDAYQDRSAILSRQAFFEQLGIPAHHKLIVFAHYPWHWSRHYEQELLAYLSEQLQARAYQHDITMIIRPHPIDPNAPERLSIFHDPPTIILEEAQMGNLDHLANLMHHMDVLINPVSTIAIDAAVLDKPIINLAIDEKPDINYYESAHRWYEWDHYKQLADTGGTRIVYDHAQLDDAISSYLQDPTQDATGRARLREWLVEPIDGKASHRLANWIIRMAHDKSLNTSPHTYPWWKQPPYSE